jgi:hypothetical protein
MFVVIFGLVKLPFTIALTGIVLISLASFGVSLAIALVISVPK